MFNFKKKEIQSDFKLFFLSKDIETLSNTLNLTITDTLIEIKNSISDISNTYSNFNDWYDNKVIPELLSGLGRELAVLVFQQNNKSQIVGVIITKETPEEKKLCTINVNKDYRKLGISTLLFEACFIILKTRNPFFTVSEEHYETFKPIIKRFNFKVTSIKDNVYLNGKKEYYINET